MPNKLTYHIITLTGLISFASLAGTLDDTASETEAAAIAKQAGVISGVVQACGQDTTRFNNRVHEAIDALALTLSDRTLATLLFQQVMNDAQATEKRTQVVSCQEALQAYQTLPLLRDDYKQTVLPQLKSGHSTVSEKQHINNTNNVAPSPVAAISPNE